MPPMIGMPVPQRSDGYCKVFQGLLAVCVTGAILKEIIEDLEWAASSTNSCVRVRLKKDPQQLIFSGEGAGDLEVGEGSIKGLFGDACAQGNVWAQQLCAGSEGRKDAWGRCFAAWVYCASAHLNVALQIEVPVSSVTPPGNGASLQPSLCGSGVAVFQHLGPAILQIEVPVCDLNGFKCAETSVSHRYKYKHLKTALSNIPQRDPAAVNSKVGRTVRTPGCSWLHCEHAASGCSAGAAFWLLFGSWQLGSVMPLSMLRVAGHLTAAIAL